MFTKCTQSLFSHEKFITLSADLPMLLLKVDIYFAPMSPRTLYVFIGGSAGLLVNKFLNMYYHINYLCITLEDYVIRQMYALDAA